MMRMTARPTPAGNRLIRRYHPWTLSLLSTSVSIHISIHIRVLSNSNFFCQDVIQRYSRGCALSHHTLQTPLQASSSPYATTQHRSLARATSSLPSGIRSTVTSTQRRPSSTSSLTFSRTRRKRMTYSMRGIRSRRSTGATYPRTLSLCPRLLARIMRV